MVCVVKEGNSKSVVAAGLRCRGLSPFSFIQSQFTSRFLPTFSLHTSARCTLQLGKLTSWQGNKYCDATLCVCFRSRKKKQKKKRRKPTKKILRNLMQSAFLSLYPLGFSPATLVTGIITDLETGREAEQTGWKDQKQRDAGVRGHGGDSHLR